jgi:DNA-binding HxlR family transcriptional regulator
MQVVSFSVYSHIPRLVSKLLWIFRYWKIIKLSLLEEKIRFNKLYDLLNENAVELTKPTLSLHLKHLTKKKLGIRKVEDVQNASYEINHKKLNDSAKGLKSTLDRFATFKRAVDEDEQAFNSASIDDQTNITLKTMILRNLQQLKTQIELKSNHVTSWEKSMELMLLTSSFFERYEKLILEKCESDKEYREKILEKISELIKEIENQNCGLS